MAIIANSRVSTLPAGIELSSGRLENAELKGTSGLNPAVGAALETICSQGGIRNVIYTAEDLKVTSTSANDTNSGSAHARRVRIRGVGSDGLFKQADVDLNGTGVVAVDRNGDAINFLHINDFRVQKVGSGSNFNAGTIKLFANDGTTLLYEIAAGENQQQSASFSLPTDTTGYLTSFVASATGAAQVSIWVQNSSTDSWKQKLTLVVGAGGPAPYQLPNPFQVGAGGIIEFRAKSLTGGNVVVGADFQIIQET
tara:strand:- start:355 stop:1116 length:762 start_codon:yes stop_codon:yes gene_type:complete